MKTRWAFKLAAAVASATGTAGCLGDECFDDLNIVTADAVAWSQTTDEFCRSRGMQLHTARGSNWVIWEICCYRDGIL